MIINRTFNFGKPNVTTGQKKVPSLEVYPSTLTATSTGLAFEPSYLDNYTFFNIAQTSLSTDLIILPSADIGTVIKFYAISAASIKAGADASGLTINGGADTASYAIPAGGFVTAEKVTSTNWIVEAAGDSAVETLVGKTISLGSNTVTGTLAQFNTACSNADFTSLTGSETLTNKTLTAPIISAPNITSSPTGDGIIQWAEVSITNAETLALRATPKTLVAAPGAGKILEFVSAQLYFDYTGAYTETSDDLAVKYTDGSGAAVSQTIDVTGFVDATADTIINALPKINALVAKSGSENKALVLHNTGDGEYGGGNAANAIRVKVAYRVWSSGF
jgi:hypothetical protein